MLASAQNGGCRPSSLQRRPPPQLDFTEALRDSPAYRFFLGGIFYN
jgi:hypothetical protein